MGFFYEGTGPLEEINFESADENPTLCAVKNGPTSFLLIENHCPIQILYERVESTLVANFFIEILARE